MSKQESAEINVQINSINVCYKPQQLTSSFTSSSGPWHAMPSRPVPEIDPDNVHLSFRLAASELQDSGGAIVMRKDDVKRLNLMVGDTVTLRITKS